MRRLRQAVAEESRCEQTSPHQGHHLRDIGWQASQILDDSQQTFVAQLAGYFVQAPQETFLFVLRPDEICQRPLR
jgi:hypothetical protein